VFLLKQLFGTDTVKETLQTAQATSVVWSHLVCCQVDNISCGQKHHMKYQIMNLCQRHALLLLFTGGTYIELERAAGIEPTVS